MASENGCYFIIGFDRDTNMPHFEGERFDTYDEMDRWFDDNEDYLMDTYWNIQYYTLDASRHFIEL